MLMATNGTVAALAVVVQRPGDQLLAGAGLAADHHRQVGLQSSGREPGRCPASPPSGRPAAWRGPASLGSRFRRGPTRLRQRAVDDGDQFVEIERLGQIIVGAASRQAWIAVMNVFWALMTMIGRSGRDFLMRGISRRRSRRASRRR